MDAQVVQAVNSLTSRWVRALPPGTTVVSGLGLWPLLAILSGAADEPGRSELGAAAEVEPAVAAARAADLVATIDRTADLQVALGVWVHEQLKLSESFGSVVPAPLTGQLTGDVTRDQARLDGWAAEHTDGLIQRMPIDVTPDLAVVLASALSLRTTWVRPFTEQVNRPAAGPWTGGSWHWLERTDRDLDTIRRYDDPAAGALSVITVQGDADVDVLLGVGAPQAQQADVLAGLLAAAAQPDAGRSGRDLLGAAQSGEGGGARSGQGGAGQGGAGQSGQGGAGQSGQSGAGQLGGAQSGQEVAPAVRVTTTTAPVPDLRLSLPSFAVEVDHDLMEHRELFGLGAVSASPQGSGHFSAISPESLLVAQAKQTVLARFFATGFEAAAVTAIGMRLTSMPMQQQPRLDVELNRPFGFVAVHRASRLPIVAGWIDRPTQPA